MCGYNDGYILLNLIICNFSLCTAGNVVVGVALLISVDVYFLPVVGCQNRVQYVCHSNNSVVKTNTIATNLLPVALPRLAIRKAPCPYNVHDGLEVEPNL